MAAFQNWYNTAASTAPVSNTVPPALIPPQGSVLNTQPVPSSYTTNRPTGNNSARAAGRSPKNTPISTTSQINQILGTNNNEIGKGYNSYIPMFGSGGGSGGIGTGASGTYISPGNYGMAIPHEVDNDHSSFFNPSSGGGDWSAVERLHNFQQLPLADFLSGLDV